MQIFSSVDRARHSRRGFGLIEPLTLAISHP
jgi:hypothetical protein